MQYDSEEYRKFEQERIDAGKLIDLNTAILDWGWGDIRDVYGVLDPVEETNIGRVYFLRAPDSDIWVNIYDLPEETRDEFWRRLEAGYYNAKEFPWPWTERDPIAAVRAAEKEGK
jgi:hypothetical protein